MTAIQMFSQKPLPADAPYMAVNPFLLVATDTEGTAAGDTAADDAAESSSSAEQGSASETSGQGETQGETHSEVGAHGGDHGGEKVFPPFDTTTFASQLFWLAITFGLFYYLMAKVIIPRIGQTLEQRHDRIATDLAEAERLKAETDEAIAAYEQALADAKAKAGDIAKTTRDSVQKTIETDRHAAESALAKQLEEAETKIAGIKAQALGEVDSIAGETTEAILSALSGVKTTKADVAKAIAEARS
jgi:F-type H+-transporting ATPase subunit b